MLYGLELGPVLHATTLGFLQGFIPAAQCPIFALVARTWASAGAFHHRDEFSQVKVTAAGFERAAASAAETESPADGARE